MTPRFVPIYIDPDELEEALEFLYDCAPMEYEDHLLDYIEILEEEITRKNALITAAVGVLARSDVGDPGPERIGHARDFLREALNNYVDSKETP